VDPAVDRSAAPSMMCWGVVKLGSPPPSRTGSSRVAARSAMRRMPEWGVSSRWGRYPHQPPPGSNMPGPVPGGSMTTCSWVSQNWPSVRA